MTMVLILDVFFLHKSYAPVLLVYKAQKFRYQSGNWALHAKHEEWDLSVNGLAQKYLVRPFQLLGRPICSLMVLYAAFAYTILCANLASFPVSFQEIRGEIL